jgi:hypothetical protein
LFTIMKKGLRTDFGPRQSPPSISKRRLQGTRRFLRFDIGKRRKACAAKTQTIS